MSRKNAALELAPNRSRGELEGSLSVPSQSGDSVSYYSRRWTRMTRLFRTLCALAITAVALVPHALAAVETNIRFSEDVQVSTCSGELVDVQMTVHLLSRVERDAQGVAHLGSTITVFFRGTSAYGDRYIGPSHQTTQLRGDVGSESVNTQTFNQNLILLGEDGTADDLRARAVFHFTFNANGELVASKFEFVRDCA
jgi:hypothetical protein